MVQSSLRVSYIVSFFFLALSILPMFAHGAEVNVVDRIAKTGTSLPSAPLVSVPAYPNQNIWYSKSVPVTVFWKVPSDVIKVAISVDDKPNTEPSKAEDVLADGKEIGELGEGVWYIHTQFKNNVGWGAVTHYRIAIDTTSPETFTLKVATAGSDDPSPEINYEAKDELSGFSEALIYVDGKGVLQTKETKVLLPPLLPGEHDVRVRVFDMAGNSSEDAVAVSIVPLPEPVILFATNSAAQTEGFFVAGTAMPNAEVFVVLRDSTGMVVLTESAAADDDGDWSLVVKDNIRVGTYQGSAFVQGSRGAVSNETSSIDIKIKPQVLVTLGVIDLSWFEMLLTFIIAACGIAGFTTWRRLEHFQLQAVQATHLARELRKVGALIEKDVDLIDEIVADKKNRMSRKVREEIGVRCRVCESELICSRNRLQESWIDK